MKHASTDLHPASWQRIWKGNWLFLLLFTLIWLVGYGIYLTIAQGEDVLFLNQRRTAFADLFFQYSTLMGEAPAYILVGLLLGRYSFRFLITVPVIGLVVTLVTAALKNYFEHLRPFAWFQMNGMEGMLQTIEGVRVNMGANSFPSGHTMAAFALFTFLFLCLPREKKSPFAALILLLVSVLVGISRIYLLKHFLKDVLLGAPVGVLLAVLLYRLQYHWLPYPHQWLDRRWSLHRHEPLGKSPEHP